jgi:hypothetical protein
VNNFLLFHNYIYLIFFSAILSNNAPPLSQGPVELAHIAHMYVTSLIRTVLTVLRSPRTNGRIIPTKPGIGDLTGTDD